MIHAGDFFVRFYLPIISGVLTIVLVWMVRDIGADGLPELRVGIPYTPFKLKLPLPQSLKRIWVARAMACAIGLLMIGWGANADFARFFPPHLRMDVYYDAKGIRHILDGFSDEERVAAEISPNWQSCESGYENEAKETLARAWSSRLLK